MRKHRGAPSEQEEQAEDRVGEAAIGFRQLAFTLQPKAIRSSFECQDSARL